MIKHVSFDLWNTLIKVNPNFSLTRRRILAKMSGKQEEEVQTIVREISVAHDNECMETGYHKPTSAHLYERVLRKLGIEPSEDDMEEFLDVMQRTFKIHEPTLICPNTLDILESIKVKGITMSILSNTGYVNGDTIRPLLAKYGISYYLNYINTCGAMYFSDELGRAKPNPALFSFVAISHKVGNNEMLHVGDSIRADGGANAIGCETLITDDKGIENILLSIDFLNKKQ